MDSNPPLPPTNHTITDDELVSALQHLRDAEIRLRGIAERGTRDPRILAAIGHVAGALAVLEVPPLRSRKLLEPGDLGA